MRSLLRKGSGNNVVLKWPAPGVIGAQRLNCALNTQIPIQVCAGAADRDILSWLAQ